MVLLRKCLSDRYLTLSLSLSFRTQMIPVISADPSVQIVQLCRTPSWFLPLVCMFYDCEDS